MDNIGKKSLKLHEKSKGKMEIKMKLPKLTKKLTRKFISFMA